MQAEENGRARVELRYYSLPRGECVLPLTGKSWRRNYGNDVPMMHFHNLTEVGVCRDGYGYLLSEEGKADYRGGTITFFPSNATHHTNTYSPNALDSWEYLFFDTPQILADHCQNDPLLARRLTEKLQYGQYIGTAANSALPTVLDSVFACLQRPASPLRTREVSSLLFAFLLEVETLLPETPTTLDRTATASTLRNALYYLDEHYAQELHIADLAAACGLSETHFRRLFVQAINMTPTEYVALIRVQHACELLRTNEESMDAIALKTGFGSLSSFNRSFVKLLGMPPYRWKLRVEHGLEGSCLNITARPGWD